MGVLEPKTLCKFCKFIGLGVLEPKLNKALLVAVIGAGVVAGVDTSPPRVEKILPKKEFPVMKILQDWIL